MNHFSNCEKRLNVQILLKSKRNYLLPFRMILFHIICILMVALLRKVGGTVMKILSQ